MAFIEVDEPAMLDSTGQEIVDKLDEIKDALTPMASGISFDNTGTDLTSTDVENVIKEINGRFINLLKTPSVAYTSGWISDAFNLPSPRSNRAILIVYNGTTTTFGFLMKRKSDDKIMSNITWNTNDNIYISGII